MDWSAQYRLAVGLCISSSLFQAITGLVSHLRILNVAVHEHFDSIAVFIKFVDSTQNLKDVIYTIERPEAGDAMFVQEMA
jgi:hypothetical protein